MAEGEAHLEPLDVVQVARDAAQERGRDAQTGEVELADGQAAARDAREVVLGCVGGVVVSGAAAAVTADEAEGLHGPAGEDGRGGGGAAAEGAEVRDVGGQEAQCAAVVA